VASLSHCNNVAGHLADITTQVEQDEMHRFLTETVDSPEAWIGLQFDGNQNAWVLSDGITKATYFDWSGAGNTAPHPTSFACAVISPITADYPWYNIVCSNFYGVLVEYDCASTIAPVSNAPITKTPASKAPVSSTPVTNTPVSKAPATKAPFSNAPVTGAPVTKPPITKTPVNASKAPIILAKHLSR
jgi:hypothetical protein